jgi:hypothetical protein
MTLCVAEEHSTNMESNSARMLGYMMPPRVPDEEAEDDEDEDDEEELDDEPAVVREPDEH